MSCDCNTSIVILGGSGGNVSTFYTTDATILGPRTVTMNGNNIVFSGTEDFTYSNAGRITASLYVSGLDDSATSPQNFLYTNVAGQFLSAPINILSTLGITTSGCAIGAGTASDPIAIKLDPTGLLACGAGGLSYTGIGDGLVAVLTSGCISGNGADNPVIVTVDPVGLLECGPQGLRYVGASGGGLSSVSTSGCLAGLGTPISPVYITLDPTGHLTCGSSGLYVSTEFLTASDTSNFISGVSTSGCISGNGVDNPLIITLNPTGLLACTASGLAFTGDIGSSTVSVTNCISGDGAPTTPIGLFLDPTGLLACGGAGLAFTGSVGGNSTVTSGCVGGIGSVIDPVYIRIDPTGLLACTASGLSYAGGTLSLSSCFSGSGTEADPVTINIDTTGLLECNANGLAYIGTPLTLSSCFTGSGTQANPVTINIDPTGLLDCGPQGLRYIGTTASGVGLLAVATETSGTTPVTASFLTPVDVSASGSTITPPTSVSVDTLFAITDSRANSTANNILIDFSGAGETFHGSLQNYIMNSDSSYAQFRFLGGAIGWIVEK